MPHRMTVLVLTLALAAACGGGGGSAGPPLQASPLLLTAGMELLAPTGGAGTGSAALGRFGVERVGSVYELTTPPATSFRFEATVRAQGSGGGSMIALGHAADGDVAPVGGPETLGDAGIVPFSNRLEAGDIWLRTGSGGQARVTVQGTIDRDQSLVLESRDGDRVSHDLVHIRIGPVSAINRQGGLSGAPYEGVEEEIVFHSSDAWLYGLPAVAQSGDRTSVVVYEAREDSGPMDALFKESWLHEIRLQLHRQSGAGTGAPPVPAEGANGIFRDHEVAGLHNVLALLRATPAGPRVELSFDRGATFAQAQTFDGGDLGALPIVQIDMAPDYGLAIAYWRILLVGGGTPGRGDPLTDPLFESQLMLVEGKPSAVDEDGSPTAYAFGTPRVLYAEDRDLMPTITGVRGTAQGDLAVAYGFTRFAFDVTSNTVTVETEYRCATRIGEDGEFTDTLVHEEEMTAIDPSVDLDGEGDALRIFYACETTDGVRLYTSADLGETFTLASQVDAPGAHMPTVCARVQEGARRVDLLYLAPTGNGLELHVRHWDDFDGGGDPVDAVLVAASIEWGGGGQATGRLVDGTMRHVGNHGYDATEVGDDVVVVVHKETIRAEDVFYRLPSGPPLQPAPEEPGLRGAPQQVEPPPLAPGLTDPVPPPDPAHRHHLCALFLD